MNRILYTLAIDFMAMTFLLSAISTTLKWEGTLGMMKARGLPQPALLLQMATGLKYLASLMMIFQIYPNLAALALLGFTILATIIFDNFWSKTGLDRQMTYFAFLSNLSIMGGLLLVVAIS